MHIAAFQQKKLSFAKTESVNSRTGSRSEANGSEHLNHLCERFVEPRFLGLIRLDYGQLDCLQAVTHQRLAIRQNNGEPLPELIKATLRAALLVLNLH